MKLLLCVDRHRTVSLPPKYLYTSVIRTVCGTMASDFPELSSMSNSRRNVLKTLGTGAAIALAGCSSSDTAGDGSGTGDGSDGQTPNSDDSSTSVGGELRFSIGRNISNISPIQLTLNGERVTSKLVYSTLTWIDSDLNVHPDLAVEWESNDASDKWTFTLREDARFRESGNQVTAHDVKATFDALYNPDIGSDLGSDTFGALDGVTVVDDFTVQFTFPQPNAFVPLYASKAMGGIMPQDVIENRLDEVSPSNDFGSGPFSIASFESQNSITLEADDDWYLTDSNGDQLPYLDSIEVSMVPKSSTQLSQLINGEVDKTWKVERSQWGRVTSESSVEAMSREAGTFVGITMDRTSEPFDDPNIWKAFRLATPRQEIIQNAANGLATMGQDSIIGPMYPSYTELPERTKNIEEAKSHLRKSDYPSEGFDLSEDFGIQLYAPNKIRVDTAVLMKEALQEIGVEVEVQQISFDKYVSEIWRKEPMYVTGLASRFSEDNYLSVWVHSDGPFADAHNWNNDQVDEWIEEARGMSDIEKRNEIYRKLQEKMYNNAPFIIIMHLDRLTAIRKNVDNYELHPLTVVEHLERTQIS